MVESGEMVRFPADLLLSQHIDGHIVRFDELGRIAVVDAYPDELPFQIPVCVGPFTERFPVQAVFPGEGLHGQSGSPPFFNEFQPLGVGVEFPHKIKAPFFPIGAYMYSKNGGRVLNNDVYEVFSFIS